MVLSYFYSLFGFSDNVTSVFCLFACLFQNSIKNIKIELFATSCEIPYHGQLCLDFTMCIIAVVLLFY